MTVDLFEQTSPQLVLFQQMTEVQDRRLVRQRARQSQTYEPSHRLDLVEHVLHTRVTQVVEQLHAVYPQHRRQLIRPAGPGPPWDRKGGYALPADPMGPGYQCAPGISPGASCASCWRIPKSANVGSSIVSSPQTSLSSVWHGTMPLSTRLVQSIPNCFRLGSKSRPAKPPARLRRNPYRGRLKSTEVVEGDDRAVASTSRPPRRQLMAAPSGQLRPTPGLQYSLPPPGLGERLGEGGMGMPTPRFLG